MSVPPPGLRAVTVNDSEIPALTDLGIPVMLSRSVEPGAVCRIVSTNASVGSPLTPLRFWFRSLPYQS